MTAVEETLPHWDMTPVYPSLDSLEFAAGFKAGIDSIVDLALLCDKCGVGSIPVDAANAADVERFEVVVNRYNAVVKAFYTLATYIQCFVAVDSRNAVAQARLSELQMQAVKLQQIDTRLTAWIGLMDVDGLIERSNVAYTHAYPLVRTKSLAAHLMSPGEEELSAELGVTGSTAWSKLYEDFTSQLEVPFETANGVELLPMSRLRNLAFDADRNVRSAAYETEIEVWRRSSAPIAAALNSIKGETIILSNRRLWKSPLDQALFAAAIDRETLDAMLLAAREYFPEFRRYMKAKARALGLERLAFYDMFAPIGQNGRKWGYGEATEFIVDNFRRFSDRMSDFAARAFRENWIDAEPRSGKVGGAFCAGLRGGESRILANYNFAFGGLSTLAHELGHGYHNLNLEHRTPLQSATPMTLAETASIFCETVITQAALGQSDRAGRIEILEESLQGSTQVVVDITSRFLFESAVFEKRAERELSAEELCELMRNSQIDTYGDGLEESALHPYMWAAKPHYYGSSFYNFPYMFGLLFALGLYARYQQSPDDFKSGYDDLLSSTGLADAPTLAARYGIELRTPDFWRASLAVIRGQVDEFERLISA